MPTWWLILEVMALFLPVAYDYADKGINMKQYKIAILEDNDALRDELHNLLMDEGYNAESFRTAAGFKKSHADKKFDTLILDLGLPDMDGMELAQEISRQDEIGIIMLTARSELRDRIDGLSIGADAYITKPFEFDELLAQLGALLRRIGIRKAELKAWRLHVTGQKLSSRHHAAVLELTASETVLLVELATSQPSHVSRAHLIRALGEDFMLYDERRLEKIISRLRTKLLDSFNASPIKAIRGRGYIFKENIELHHSAD